MERRTRTIEERKAIVDNYWTMRDKDPALSIRMYANLRGLSYYVFRDYMRDARINTRYFQMRREAQKCKADSEDSRESFTFVKIGEAHVF